MVADYGRFPNYHGGVFYEAAVRERVRPFDPEEGYAQLLQRGAVFAVLPLRKVHIDVFNVGSHTTIV
jgi:hypothetical protein